MNKPLQKRILRLETEQNPQLCVEDLLRLCDEGDDAQPIPHVPGASVLLDFLHALAEELAAEECSSSAATSD